VTAEALLGERFTAPAPALRLEASGEVREGLSGTLAARRLLARGREGALRVDAYEARGDLSPLRLVGAGAPPGLALPFALSAGAEVRFSRLFETQEEADRARPLTPLDLPFDVARALALPEGAVVEAPLTAQVSLSVSGQLLSALASRAPALSPLLSTSATGLLSGAAQGALLLRGETRVLVARHEGAWVRLRVGSSSSSRASAGATVSAGLSARAAFVPSARVERARALKDALLAWGRRPSGWVKAARARLDELSRGLPRALQLALRDVELAEGPPARAEALRAASAVADDALELLERGEGAAEALEAWLAEAVERRLGAVDAALNPLFDRVRRYSERALNLSASVSLDAEVTRALRASGDYLLDLSAPEGRLAFEAALSGAARWEGLVTEGALAGWSAEGFIDLTLAQALAEEGAAGVRLLSRAALSDEGAEVRVRAAAPLLAATATRAAARRALTVETAEGGAARWGAELWRVQRELRAGPVEEAEALASGLVYPLEEGAGGGGAGWREGAYWLSWRRRWPAHESTPVSRALGEALNLTGAAGLALGVPALFLEEAPGALSARVTLTLRGALLDALFERADPDLLWEAAARAAVGFDNTFGLPFLGALSRPAGLSPRASASCDAIAYHWGLKYCWVVEEELVAPLMALRASARQGAARVEAQRDLLAALYGRTLLLNPVGARVVARVLSELAALWAAEVGVEVGALLGLSARLEHPTRPAALTASELGRGRGGGGGGGGGVAEWLGLAEGVEL